LRARWLEATGRDDAGSAASKLRSVRRLVLLTLACEGWVALRYVPYSDHALAYGGVALAMTGCAVAGWRDATARAANAVAFALLLGVVVSAFPHNANHQFLALLLLALQLLVGGEAAERDADARTALASMRWLAGIGIVWAGVMKLYYGYWLDAEFLSYRIATDPGFRWALGFLVPSAELGRLTGLGVDVGAGPFRAEAPLLVAVSNLTWILEIVLPMGLLVAATRRLAMVATIVLFVVIQLGAREVFFGGLMVGLLLLFERRDRVAPFLPLAALVYAGWMLHGAILRWLGPGGAA
jgi:hypothetical protein